MSHPKFGARPVAPMKEPTHRGAQQRKREWPIRSSAQPKRGCRSELNSENRETRAPAWVRESFICNMSRGRRGARMLV